ncbi:MAG: hypothetical protein WKF43_01625 [Acidimicrobiales bacterium]
MRFVSLFVVLALPVAAVLWAIVGPLIAVVYLAGQTAFLTFGLRRRQVPVLRMTPEGLSYEPGRFQRRCRWTDGVALGPVVGPTGTVECLLLEGSHLHWAADPGTRGQVIDRGWDRVIPVADFEAEWRTGPIGRAVTTWAPHLLRP